MKPQQATALLSIGGLALAIVADGTGWRDLGSYGPYSQFVVPRASSSRRLALCDDTYEIASLPSPAYRTGSRWSLHRTPDELIVVTYASGGRPYQVLDYRPAVESGEIHLLLSFGEMPATLDLPLIQAFFIDLLSKGNGVLLHGCAVETEGVGLAFVGQSGAGKSTIGRLWLETGRGTVLCDDRIVVSNRTGNTRVYGTPWHGDLPFVSAASPALHSLYLLRHGATNEVRRLEPAEAVGRLMSAVFPTWWDARGMAFTLEFLEQLVRDVPCFELGFVPSPETVDFILDRL